MDAKNTGTLYKAAKLIDDGGLGHTSSLYINTITEKEKQEKFYNSMKTCRVLINTPSSQGGIGDLYNFKLEPSLTLGCGSWGKNAVSGLNSFKMTLNGDDAVVKVKTFGTEISATERPQAMKPPSISAVAVLTISLRLLTVKT